jgi:hypothetical protein
VSFPGPARPLGVTPENTIPLTGASCHPIRAPHTHSFELRSTTTFPMCAQRRPRHAPPTRDHATPACASTHLGKVERPQLAQPARTRRLGHHQRRQRHPGRHSSGGALAAIIRRGYPRSRGTVLQRRARWLLLR